MHTNPALPIGGANASRREQILAAAAELFADRGFHGVGIDDIGAAVGISGPALYRHFRSKQAMLGEMLTSISAYLLEGGGEHAERGADPHDVLARLVRFHIDFALTQPALITVQERNFGNLSEDDRKQVRALQRRYIEVWVDALRAAVPHLGDKEARAGAHAVFGLLNSTPHNRQQMPQSELSELLAKLALGALYAT